MYNLKGLHHTTVYKPAFDIPSDIPLTRQSLSERPNIRVNVKENPPWENTKQPKPFPRQHSQDNIIKGSKQQNITILSGQHTILYQPNIGFIRRVNSTRHIQHDKHTKIQTSSAVTEATAFNKYLAFSLLFSLLIRYPARTKSGPFSLLPSLTNLSLPPYCPTSTLGSALRSTSTTKGNVHLTPSDQHK